MIYLAIARKGRLYAYPVCPFGFAEACRDYTWTMGKVYRPLRLHSYLLSYVIDDAL